MRPFIRLSDGPFSGAALAAIMPEQPDPHGSPRFASRARVKPSPFSTTAFAGKTVVIIGGTAGLGLSAARAILTASSRVFARGRGEATVNVGSVPGWSPSPKFSATHAYVAP